MKTHVYDNSGIAFAFAVVTIKASAIYGTFKHGRWVYDCTLVDGKWMLGEALVESV